MNKKEGREIVVVLGMGYVGLPLALVAARKGYKVIGLDTNETKINQLITHKLGYKDERIENDLRTTEVEFSTNFEKIASADLIVICVPTPVDEKRNPDYAMVVTACESIGRQMKSGTLVILESTVNPGLCNEIVIPILERETRMIAGVDFDLAYCPERVNPGDNLWHVGNIPRVLGGINEISTKKAEAFYSQVVEAPIMRMGSLKEAEAVKVVENSFRNVNIAFVNELARSFAKLDIDIVNVIDGAATKPFGFMPFYPCCGVGGHCIPVDPYYLIDYAQKRTGFDHTLLRLALHINEEMPYYTIGLLVEELKKKNKSLKESTVAVLGLAYKSDVSDLRESPAEVIIKLLKDSGAKVQTFDPFVPGESTSKNINEVLSGADAVVVATAHTEFKKLTPEVFLRMGVRIVIDGRNCLEKEQYESMGIAYRGIGR